MHGQSTKSSLSSPKDGLLMHVTIENNFDRGMLTTVPDLPYHPPLITLLTGSKFLSENTRYGSLISSGRNSTTLSASGR